MNAAAEKKKKRELSKEAVSYTHLPIVFMVIFSFNESKSLTHFTGFSLNWYEKLFQNRDMMESLYVTITVAVIATIVSTIVGTISAIGLSKSSKIVKKVMMQLNDFPIMNPEIVTAIGLMLLFITFHIERGFMTMLLAHITFCIPCLLYTSRCV